MLRQSCCFVCMRILILSTDPELSLLRQHALRCAGHETATPISDREIDNAFDGQPNDFDVVLLCHRLPDGRARELIRRFLRSNPQGKVVAIVHMYGEWPQIEADRYVVGTDGPEALTRVMADITSDGGTGIASAAS
jgi:DNA-binding response OmpR family regulator